MIYESIGGWFQYEDVYREFVGKAKDGDVFVELGTFQGRSSAFMAETIKDSGKKIKFYTVDNHDFYHSMTPYEREKNGVSGGFDLTLEDVLRNLEPLKDYVTVIKANSWEGIPGVETCDVCWVDASHEYSGVKKDLEYWLPRAKVIGGDDYMFEGVGKAVDELAPQRTLKQSSQNPGQYLWLVEPNVYFKG